MTSELQVTDAEWRELLVEELELIEPATKVFLGETTLDEIERVSM